MTESMFFVDDTDAVCNIPYILDIKEGVKMHRISEVPTPSERSACDNKMSSILYQLNQLSKSSPY